MTTTKEKKFVANKNEWIASESAKILERSRLPWQDKKDTFALVRESAKNSTTFTSESLYDVARFIVRKEALFLASYTESESALKMFFDVVNTCYSDIHASAEDCTCGNDIARDLITDVYVILLENDVQTFADIFGESAKTITRVKPTKSKYAIGENIRTKTETLTLSKYISRMIRDYFNRHHKALEIDSLEEKFVDIDGEQFPVYESKKCESVFADIFVTADNVVTCYQLEIDLADYIDTLAVKYNLTTNEKLALSFHSVGLPLSAISKMISQANNTKGFYPLPKVKALINNAYLKIAVLLWDYLEK